MLKHAKATGSKLVLFNPLTINVAFEGGKKIDYRIEQTKQQKLFLPYCAYQSCTETDYEVYFDENPEGIFCELWIPVKLSTSDQK